jgi:hypothetical protein
MNATDKFIAGGSFSFDAAAGMIKASGSIQKLDQDLKKRTKVSVVVRQMGGSPTALMRLLPANAIACSLDDLQPCMDTMTAISNYMKNDFQTILENGGSDGWNAMQLTVARYDESGLETLTPTGGFTVIDDNTRNARRNLENRNISESLNAARAQTIIDNGKVYPYLQDDLISSIKTIYQQASDNADTLAKAQTACYDDIASCTAQASATLSALPVYDTSLLSIDLSQKRRVGNFYYYNIIGGYDFGGKYDDTNPSGNSTVAQIDLNAVSLVNASNLSNKKDTRLTGIRIIYANGKQVVHGVLKSRFTQSLNLRNDAIAAFKICLDASSAVPTPRVVGLVVQTASGRALAMGNVLESNCTDVAIPQGEEFIGLIGSSGAELDSLGPITRNTGGS